jgi:hypothetical protein
MTIFAEECDVQIVMMRKDKMEDSSYCQKIPEDAPAPDYPRVYLLWSGTHYNPVACGSAYVFSSSDGDLEARVRELAQGLGVQPAILEGEWKASDGSDIVVQDAAVTRNGVESSEAIVLKGVDVVWNGWRLIKVEGTGDELEVVWASMLDEEQLPVSWKRTVAPLRVTLEVLQGVWEASDNAEITVAGSAVTRDGETFEAEIEVGLANTTWGAWRIVALENNSHRRVVTWKWNDDVVSWVQRKLRARKRPASEA